MRVLHDGHDEPTLRADGDAEVHEVLVDDVVTADLRIDGRNLGERGDAGAREERHEPEPDAVRLLETLFVRGAERHHGAHVDLVEGREDRGGVLRLYEALGDPLPEPAERHGLLAFLSRRRADRREARG